jgi:hypothetical protein
MGHKIALISDIHFGCRNNSEKYLTIMKNFFLDTLVKTLKQNNVKDLRILGDLFDNRNNINIRTMNTVLYVFRELNKQLPDLSVSILLGNHDIYYHNRIDINSLECLREIPNINIIDKVTEEIIDNRRIISIPWLIKDTEVYSDFIRAVKAKTKYDFCFGHFEIKDFEMVRGIKDETGLNHDIFSNFSKVFTGHYHIRNTIKNMSYLGCPYQLTWNDYGDTKGIHIIDVKENKVTFIENKDSPCFVRLTMEDIVNKNKSLINKIPNNFIKLVIEKKYKESFIIKVINKIENMNPLKLDIQNDYVESYDVSDIDTTEFKDLSDPLSLLLKYISDRDEEFSEENEIDEKELNNYLRELYELVLREND